MNTIVIITLLAIVAIQSSSAIKCYSCGEIPAGRKADEILRQLTSSQDSMCIGNRKQWKTEDCGPEVATCGRLQFGDNVLRACGSLVPDCTVFTTESKLKCSKCSTDLCNSSSAMQMSLAAFAAIISSFLIKNIF